MSCRDHVLTVMLWLAIIGMGSWAGGTLYQMIEVVPVWSASPPESVRTFFRDTDFGRHKVRFFGPATMVARNLPLILALVAAWPRPRHRGWLLLAIGCFAFGLILTLAYVYPINAVLFNQAGGSATDGEIRSMVSRWVLADRVRFVVGLVGLFAVLQAFRLPIGSPVEVSRTARNLS
jgi:Anthrone oxygenase